MEKENIKQLIEKINDSMLCLSNETIDEVCPIGIIDFDTWEWPQGVGLYGMYLYYKETGNLAYRDALVKWYTARIAEGLPTRNVNTTAPMLTLAFLAQELDNQEWLALCGDWAQWVLLEMPRTQEGGLQHIVSGETNEQQLWDDTLFMTVLFLAKMGTLTQNKAYLDEAEYQFLLHVKYLSDPVTGLWYHGWTFLGRHNFAKAFWARGNCWITAGIPDFIEIVQPAAPLKRYLTGVLAAQVETLAKLQAESGLWHTLLDDDTSYEESSASSGFAYGILKGVQMGLLDEKYLDVAKKAVEAVIAVTDASGVVGQVSYGTGMGHTLQHYRDIPLCPMAYGQSLAVVMLAAYLKM